MEPPAGSPSRARAMRAAGTWLAGTRIRAAAGREPIGDVLALELFHHLAGIPQVQVAVEQRHRPAPLRSASSASITSMPTVTAPMAASRIGPRAFSPSSKGFIRASLCLL